MGTELQETLAQNLSRISDVQGFLIKAKEKSVLLIDEIDQLPKLLQVTLYRALEEGRIFLNSSSKKAVNTITLESITIIGCTNFPEFLLKPLRERFKLYIPFEFYKPQEIELILKNRCKRIGWAVQDSVFTTIAERSRGVPRIGLRLVESARRVSRANGDDCITYKYLQYALELEGIDDMSLTEIERQYLSILEEQNNLARLNVIATCLGHSARSLSHNIEPYLIRSGFVTKDPKNGCRMLTPMGLNHIRQYNQNIGSNTNEEQ